MYSGDGPSTSGHHHSDQPSFYPHTSAHIHGQVPSSSGDGGMDSSIPPSSSSPQYMEMMPMRASNGSGIHYGEGGEGGSGDFPMEVNPIEETVEMEEEMPSTSRQEESPIVIHEQPPPVIQPVKPPTHKSRPKGYDMKRMIRTFWPMQKKRVENMTTKHLREASRNQVLPLARVKKIMKIDDNVQKQMIAADAPLLLSVASEMFIEELTLRSWEVTEEAKRKTLQKVDVATACVRHDHMDFLIDIIPRTGVLPRPKEPPRNNMPQAQVVQIVRDGGSMEGAKFVLKGGNTLISASDSGPSTSSHHEFSARLESGEEAQVIQIGKPIPLSSQAMTQLGLGNLPPPSSSHSHSHPSAPSIRLVSRDAPPHRTMKMVQKRPPQGQGQQLQLQLQPQRQQVQHQQRPQQQQPGSSQPSTSRAGYSGHQ